MPEKENRVVRNYKGSISYKKLWDLLASRGIKKIDLRREPFNLSPTLVNRLIQNTNVAVDTIMFFCEYFNVQPGDILEYIPPQKTDEH